MCISELVRRVLPLNKDARSILAELGYHKNKDSEGRVFIGQKWSQLLIKQG